jgi:DNA-binding MarR family transcriptional regulator
MLKALGHLYNKTKLQVKSEYTTILKSRYTHKQGQYLAYIYYYTKIHRVAPAEADIQRYFKVTAPAVHQMITTLENQGLIDKVPGRARTIRVLISREELPDLE